MKKLFFIAAMATFAIGAATAQQVCAYLLGENTLIPCGDYGFDCGIMLGTDIAYTVPAYNPEGAQQGDPATIIDIGSWEYTGF